MLSLLVTLASAQACPDASLALTDALDQLIMMDEGALSEAMSQADQSFDCAWTDPETLATWWLVKGAQHQLANDEPAIREAFAMAQFVAPDFWLDALGESLRAIYEEEKAKARPRSQLNLTGIGEAQVRVDGKRREYPVALVPGTHLVQIGVNGVEERRDVVIVIGQGAVIDMGRGGTEAVDPPKDGTVAKEPSSSPVGLDLWAGAGFGYAGGEAVEANGQVEEATKLSVPLEGGIVLRLGPAWIRGQAAYAPLLGGQLLYLSGEEVQGAGAFVHAGAAAGVSFAGFHVGGQGTATIPSRTGVRGLLGRDIVGPLGIELRGGANLHPERAPEPAFEAMLRIQPKLF